MNSDDSAIDFCSRRISEQNTYIDATLMRKDLTVERQKELIYSAHRVKMKLKQVLAVIIQNQRKTTHHVQEAKRKVQTPQLFTDQNNRVHHHL